MCCTHTYTQAEQHSVAHAHTRKIECKYMYFHMRYFEFQTRIVKYLYSLCSPARRAPRYNATRRGARFAAATNSALRAAAVPAEAAAARVGRFHPFFRRCFAFCWSAARGLSISFQCSDTHTHAHTRRSKCMGLHRC